MNGLADLGWPLLCNLGFSGAVGFCTGVALKVPGLAFASAFVPELVETANT